MIKSLGNSATLEQKVAQLAKNFIELERENNRQTASLKQNEKVLEKEQREKEHLQREYNKGVLIRYIIFVTFFSPYILIEMFVFAQRQIGTSMS